MGYRISSHPNISPSKDLKIHEKNTQSVDATKVHPKKRKLFIQKIQNEILHEDFHVNDLKGSLIFVAFLDLRSGKTKYNP
jgi:hypothetical protein